jgi:phi13 family phage major tail protein
MAKEIWEWRGVENLVCAEVTSDTKEAYETGEVFDIAGVAELGRTTENSSETKYYDNVPALVIDSVGADTVTCSVSGIPLDVLAKITGQHYDESLGVLVEGEREAKYYALGYKTKKTNGNEVYVWRYKGKFSIPDSTHSTQTAGTEANGQEIVFTGISTTHKFTKTGKPAKAINVDVALDKADVTTFFDTVTTIDTLQVKA